MIFTGVCLITGDVPRLVQFYEYVLRCPARGDDTRAEIATPGCALTICTQQAARSDMGFGLTSSCGASRTILRFAVDDVDEEYQRLRRVDVSFACLPTSHSWGARTVHFHDPDGNLVSFYRPLAQPEADTDASADSTGA
ncbi:MAG: VOC family protein [Eubacteriales bacterium]|nr:VOC family protein [Eubacteriales bacterium]